MLTGDFNVHAKQTTDQVHRDEHGRDEGDLAENLVDMIAQHQVGHVQLRKVVGVRTAQHLFEMGQVGHHGHNVILDVTQIQTDVSTRSHRVLLIAALGKPSNDIGLATQKAHQTHDLLS